MHNSQFTQNKNPDSVISTTQTKKSPQKMVIWPQAKIRAL